MSSMPPSQPARRPPCRRPAWRTSPTSRGVGGRAGSTRRRRAGRPRPCRRRPRAARADRRSRAPRRCPRASARCGRRRRGPRSRRRVDTDLDARPPGACLSTFVTASWTTAVGGGVQLDARGARIVRPAARARSSSGRRSRRRASEQIGQPRHLGQRLLAGRADRGEALAPPAPAGPARPSGPHRPGRPSPPGCGRRCRAARARSGRARGGPRAAWPHPARPRVRACARPVLDQRRARAHDTAGEPRPQRRDRDRDDGVDRHASVTPNIAATRGGAGERRARTRRRRRPRAEHDEPDHGWVRRRRRPRASPRTPPAAPTPHAASRARSPPRGSTAKVPPCAATRSRATASASRAAPRTSSSRPSER